MPADCRPSEVPERLREAPRGSARPRPRPRPERGAGPAPSKAPPADRRSSNLSRDHACPEAFPRRKTVSYYVFPSFTVLKYLLLYEMLIGFKIIPYKVNFFFIVLVSEIRKLENPCGTEHRAWYLLVQNPALKLFIL